MLAIKSAREEKKNKIQSKIRIRFSLNDFLLRSVSLRNSTLPD